MANRQTIRAPYGFSDINAGHRNIIIFNHKKDYYNYMIQTFKTHISKEKICSEKLREFNEWLCSIKFSPNVDEFIHGGIEDTSNYLDSNGNIKDFSAQNLDYEKNIKGFLFFKEFNLLFIIDFNNDDIHSFDLGMVCQDYYNQPEKFLIFLNDQIKQIVGYNSDINLAYCPPPPTPDETEIDNQDEIQ